MSSLQIDTMIGNAWRLHREGDNTAAIKEFKEILKTAPTNVDAYYGMGLALRADGQTDAAIDAFNKALETAQQAYNASRQLSQADGGHPQGNDLSSIQDDRFMMLTRMIRQRLADLGVTVKVD